MNVWVGWHKLHDGQGDMPIFQSKHEADKWVSQYKPGFAKLITLTEQKPWVGLTDEDVYPLANAHLRHQPESYEVSGIYGLVSAIEAKLREKNAQPSKPLTDEQIIEMYNEPRSDAEMLEFARAIEAAHGIKE